MTYNLKNRDALLSDLAALLAHGKEPGGNQELNRIPLINLKVTFFRGKTKLYEILGGQVALQYLVDDVYWNEDANWADADRLEVRVY